MKLRDDVSSHEPNWWLLSSTVSLYSASPSRTSLRSIVRSGVLLSCLFLAWYILPTHRMLHAKMYYTRPFNVGMLNVHGVLLRSSQGLDGRHEYLWEEGRLSRINTPEQLARRMNRVLLVPEYQLSLTLRGSCTPCREKVTCKGAQTKRCQVSSQ